MKSSIISTTRSDALIGTAVSADTFILIEAAQPWSKPALLSEDVPESLRQVVKPLLVSGSAVRVHLIANEQTPTHTRRRILVFSRAVPSQAGLTQPTAVKRVAKDYKAWEIQVDTPEAMAPALSRFLHNSVRTEVRDSWRIRPITRYAPRHLAICTHASHNECCGLYGYPFYQAAIARIQQLGLTQQIQPWQISHIGGHRFAPTLIDFPQGRYYGDLDEGSLECLLKQTGEIAPLLSTYRGWSLLPKPLQILEAELFHQREWEWLKSRVAGRILTQNDAQKQFWVELWVESADQLLSRYTAEIHGKVLHSYQLETEFEDELTPLMYRKTG